MELDLVIPIVIAVVPCIVGCIICWCRFKTRHRQTHSDVVPQMYQWQIPEDTAYPQGLALQSRHRVPGFSEFIQNVIELFSGQRLANSHPY